MDKDQLISFTKMQEDITHLKDDVSEIKSDIKKGAADTKETLEKMTEKIDAMIMRSSSEITDLARDIEKKYAGKWVERVLWGIGGIVGTTIVVALLKGIIIK